MDEEDNVVPEDAVGRPKPSSATLIFSNRAVSKDNNGSSATILPHTVKFSGKISYSMLHICYISSCKI
jgi:hypothetical protein